MGASYFLSNALIFTFMKFSYKRTYCVVFEEDWAPLILDKEKEMEEDDEERYDDEDDDSQATVNQSAQFHS